MTATNFGARLRALRMKSKLSLQGLADKVGASKAHIWEMEQGNTKNPSLALLTELSRALNVPIKELVGVMHLDRLDVDRALILVQAEDKSYSLKSIPLP